MAMQLESQVNANLEIEPQTFSKQSHQFWTLQISGWLGYAIVVFMAIIHPQFDDPNFNLTGQLLNLLIETLSGFSLSVLLWAIIRKTVHRPLNQTLFLSFFSAAVLGLVFNVIKLASYKTVVYGQVWYEELNLLEFGGWFLFSLTTMFVWTAIFFVMLYNTKLQKEHEMLLRAQNAAKEAQLQMLRYQLNPHFMFNTMNAISTLIYKQDNQTAGEMLDQLCAFFRYSLEQKSDQKATLKKELELLDLYLSIEKVRFADKLTVKWLVEDASHSALVPTLLLQPIVENAIKYSIEASKQNGSIEIKTELIGKRVRISIKDSGSDKQQTSDSGFGIGLKNTKERLATMYNDNYQLSIEHKADGTQVSLTIPYLSGEE
mgnify:CR=1 FL=1